MFVIFEIFLQSFMSVIPMKCLWNHCDEEIDELHIKEHVDKHAKETINNICLWENCPRNKELLSNKYALQAHMRIHTGDKPFKCKICEKVFSRTDALNKHIKKHELEEKQRINMICKIFNLSDDRECLEHLCNYLLEERQFEINCLRILQDELLWLEDGNKADDSWEKYNF